MNSNQGLNAQVAMEKYRLKRGAWGYFLALMAGLTYPFLNSLWSIAQGLPPYVNTVSIWDIVLVGITVAAVSDLFAGGWMVIWNLFHHKGGEYKRAMKSRSGKYCVLAGLYGGPIAMGGVCIAINLCPIPYVMAISATFPVFGAIFSSIALKEKLSARLWVGIIIVVLGAALVSWSSPDSADYPYFALGIILSLVSSIGLALDCCTGTYGMDMLDPYVAVGIKLFSSSAANIIIMLPLISILGSKSITSGWVFLGEALTVWPYVLIMIAAAIFGATTWTVNYSSMAIIGASRGIAINASFALWGIPVSLLFSALGLIPYEVSTLCIVGAVILFAGSVIVVLNPKELLSVRDHSDQEVK